MHSACVVGYTRTKISTLAQKYFYGKCMLPATIKRKAPDAALKQHKVRLLTAFFRRTI
jgi:hypothetical protein